MKTFLWTATPLLLSLMAPAQSQPNLQPGSQTNGLDAVLAGRDAPLSLMARNLNPAFRRIVVGDAAGDVQAMMIGAQTGIEINLYFTRGDTVSLGGETFLIAYRPQNRLDLQALQQMSHAADNPPLGPQKLRPDAPLLLSLLNLRAVKSLNDIRPFDPKLDIETPQEGDAATARTLERLGRDFITWTRTRGRGTLPVLGASVTPQLIRAMYPQVHDPREWRHPVTGEFFRPNAALSGLKLSSIRNSRALVMFAEATPAANGTRAVLFIDGRVERVAAAQWPRVQAVKPLTGTVSAPRATGSGFGGS